MFSLLVLPVAAVVRLLQRVPIRLHKPNLNIYPPGIFFSGPKRQSSLVRIVMKILFNRAKRAKFARRSILSINDVYQSIHTRDIIQYTIAATASSYTVQHSPTHYRRRCDRTRKNHDSLANNINNIKN